jgi:hypothetical protein
MDGQLDGQRFRSFPHLVVRIILRLALLRQTASQKLTTAN